MWYLSWWADSYMTSTFWSLHLVNPLPFELGVTCELLLFFLFFRVFFLSSLDMFSLFFRESKREGETSMQDRSIDWLPLIRAQTRDHTCLNRGPNLQPRYVPSPGIKPTTFQLQDNTPANAATRAGALWLTLKQQNTAETGQVAVICTQLAVGVSWDFDAKSHRV